MTSPHLARLSSALPSGLPGRLPGGRMGLALGVGLLLSSCGGSPSDGGSYSGPGFEVKMLVGSALQDFCDQAAEQFNATSPETAGGDRFNLTCEAKGSGDVVEQVATLAQQLQSGTIQADAPEFPTLISVDGEIYQDQLVQRVEQLFPGQNYIPAITDAPLLANSPMVFMTTAELAESLNQSEKPFEALVTAQTHQDLNAASPALPIHYVHTAPTRSNSGLQTLTAQFAEVSGKRPEELTPADIEANQGKVSQIQSKITRYGTSTGSLAQSMVENGPFWASMGSVYESSVITANEQAGATGGTKYVAVYPKATFTSNMRGILPNAPWVSAQEKEAAEQVLEYLQSPQAQTIATNLGLRPGTPGVDLGPKFSPAFGVDPGATYDSYRIPSSEVVTAMLTSWAQQAKKPSQVVVVVDSSGSMDGQKIAAVQNTLKTYVDSLGPKDKIALIDFDGEVREPVIVEGNAAGQAAGLQFIGNLRADGDTRLYDAALAARNWLQANPRPEAINAVLVLTDGNDSGSTISLADLEQQLKTSGFGSDDRIAFFTVGYGGEGDYNAAALEQIAQLNGGYFKKGDPATIAQLMADLQLEF